MNKMEIKDGYNLWAEQYDTNANKTRDLEGKAFRENLAGYNPGKCLEIGCGTGKNTEWLLQNAEHITAVDFSEEMIARAKEKIHSDKVQFIQADIRDSWDFLNSQYDLVSFSLVLEHIQNLDHIFQEASRYFHLEDTFISENSILISSIPVRKQGSKQKRVSRCWNVIIIIFQIL